MKYFYSYIVIFTILLLSYVEAATLDSPNTVGIDSLNKNVSISVTVEKELFPVIAKIINEGDAKLQLPAFITWHIQNNNSEPVVLKIISSIPEWTPQVITDIELLPGETKVISQTPFGQNLLSNNNIIPASVELKVKLIDDFIFEETRSLNIRAADDMIWSLHSPYDVESIIAAWVTPNDPAVEKLLGEARQRLFNKQFAVGYKDADVEGEAKAIFNTVRAYGVGYVNSTSSFGRIGDIQRVRFPNESINEKSANCIDGVVLFASLFENIGLEPLIFLVPDHAFIGLRLAPNSQEVLFIETTLVGRSRWESLNDFSTAFTAALKKGSETYLNYSTYSPRSIKFIDIKKMRQSGIYPMK